VTEDIYVRDYLKLFLNEMNKMAKDFDMKNTTFANPHGLANNFNKSSCVDMAKVTYQALQNDEFKKIVATKKHKAYIKTVLD
jgi:serine-type D-Ala-D-Ala carboxypeptidase (penicillin-binding protein 5/6)